MYKPNDCNMAVIAGTLTEPLETDHMLYGERFYTSKISVPRLSGTVDVLPVTIPERICLELPQKGDMIRVEGQLRSYNKHTESGSRLVITLFCHDIEFLSADDETENHVEITGYICKDAIYRTTPFLREICDIIIAVNRSYNKSDYLPCIAWGRNAAFAKSLSVGTCVRINGRFQSREYLKRFDDGSEELRTAYELSCSSLEEEYVT
ncbi:MAG: single-stranded DNA-binding protein [Clostridia bacterium]|nr:single-stranded DNA-binding protein [Clostridia bacterium]